MIRFILLSILLTIVLRALSRLWAGVVRGMQGGPDGYSATTTGGARVPQRGVQMARDPICGTFVVPERAIVLSRPGNERAYFCSTDCRDKFRAQEASQAPAHGRTA